MKGKTFMTEYKFVVWGPQRKVRLSLCLYNNLTTNKDRDQNRVSSSGVW